ncbi:MAG: hypothetical protein VX730_07670 [Pseudomonadota bacterium]|nr:hypothetical protein [Pseudomonadota bacterium]
MNLNFISKAIDIYGKENGKTINNMTDFVIIHDGQSTIIDGWNVAGLAEPTLEELAPYVMQAEAEHNATVYKTERKKAYPDMGEQLDAIWKGFAALEASGTTLDAYTSGMLETVQAVKSMYPKP